MNLSHSVKTLFVFFWVLACAASANAQGQAFSEKLPLAPPGPKQFVLDKAGLLNQADEQKIKRICEALLRKTATPIIVVTIGSMSEYGASGIRIETFARLLFDQWRIGQAEINGKVWNTGILLVVSQNDRKARIELGAGWKHDKDAEARRIMNDLIVPHFKQGDYSGGILAGVEALDKMAQGLAIPRPPTPWWHYALFAGAAALVIFTVVSLIRRGASGWAWLFWGLVFAGVGALLYHMATSSRSGGGGFGGGSFGGGFSGGGGATGSW